MAANRFGIKIDKGLSETWGAEWVVASGAVGTIASGTPAKISGYDASGFGSGAVIPMVTGDGLVGAANARWQFAGIAKSTSTDTAAAAGIVDLWVPIPGLVYRAYATTAANVDTQAEINALMGKRVLFDLTGSNWTVDVSQTDALVNCIVIVGGNPRSAEVNFIYSPKGTFLDTATAVTS